jgi:hypothetical protein
MSSDLLRPRSVSVASVMTSRASFQGSRDGNGVTVVPRYTRFVRSPMAVSVSQGSYVGHTLFVSCNLKAGQWQRFL